MKIRLFTVLACALLSAASSSAATISGNQQFLRTLQSQIAARQQAFSQAPVVGGEISQQNQDWLANMQQQMQSRMAPDGKAVPHVMYLLSFSIPEEGLQQMLPAAKKLGIPAYVNGLIDNNFKKTVETVFRLTRGSQQGGIQIDPRPFTRFGIRSVPALVVTCGDKHDVIYGNLRLRDALERVAGEGECGNTARKLLQEAHS